MWVQGGNVDRVPKRLIRELKCAWPRLTRWPVVSTDVKSELSVSASSVCGLLEFEFSFDKYLRRMPNGVVCVGHGDVSSCSLMFASDTVLIK